MLKDPSKDHFDASSQFSFADMTARTLFASIFDMDKFIIIHYKTKIMYKSPAVTDSISCEVWFTNNKEFLQLMFTQLGKEGRTIKKVTLEFKDSHGDIVTVVESYYETILKIQHREDKEIQSKLEHGYILKSQCLMVKPQSMSFGHI